MDDELVALAGVEAAGALRRYFQDVDLSADLRCDLGLLQAAQAIAWTHEFRAFHPAVRELQGIILDDPGTSDHHVALCRPPFSGAVLYLAHDGETRILFASVASFLAAARRALQDGSQVDATHGSQAWMPEDQAGLKALIAALQTGTDAEEILPTLLPSLALSDTDFLSALVDSCLIHVPEAVARAIAARPASHLAEVARLCMNHQHAMVRNAGVVAMGRIESL